MAFWRQWRLLLWSVRARVLATQWLWRVGSVVAIPGLWSTGSVAVGQGLVAPGHVGASQLREPTRDSRIRSGLFTTEPPVKPGNRISSIS